MEAASVEGLYHPFRTTAELVLSLLSLGELELA